jgi:hypothetical protein
VPVPACVAVAEIGLTLEASIGDLDQAAGGLDANIHILDFIAPLVLIRPPYARALFFAGGIDQGLSHGIFAEDKAVETTHLHGVARVIELNGVNASVFQCLGKVNINGAACGALVLERLCASPRLVEHDFVDVEGWYEVKLNAASWLKHPEADNVLAAEHLMLWIHAYVEVIVYARRADSYCSDRDGLVHEGDAKGVARDGLRR